MRRRGEERKWGGKRIEVEEKGSGGKKREGEGMEGKKRKGYPEKSLIFEKFLVRGTLINLGVSLCAVYLYNGILFYCIHMTT